MDAILDFSQPLSVPLLDRVVNAFFSGRGQELKDAQRVLTTFQENPDSWQRVPQILDESTNPQTKYLALQIMDKLILTRWKVLPPDQQSGIRNFVVATVVKVSSDEQTLRKEKSFVNKLNLILIAILKQTWPDNWPTFIPELVASSRSSLSICENNMTILKLLSEEIFDFGADNMTQNRTKAMKARICDEFNEVFQLCAEIVANGQKPSLIKSTLEALYRFLSWMPLGYIFETELVDNLVSRFLGVPDFRNITLKCLSEIVGLHVSDSYDPKFYALFTMVLGVMTKTIPIDDDHPDRDLVKLYEQANQQEQELINDFAIFLTNFLSVHGTLIEGENQSNPAVFENAYAYLLRITLVDEREIFKICLEFWNKLLSELYAEKQQLPMGDLHPLVAGLTGQVFGGVNGLNGWSQGKRGKLFTNILSNLRLTMIKCMVKPEEVLVVENDEGEVVREFLKEVDTIVLYKQMREALVYLTHLDTMDTENIMTEKLRLQISGAEWSWNNLSKLCWAIGSISGAMSEDAEKRFLVAVIKDLLALTEMKRGKDNKAVVASNIMYIVGQYPRFLRAHWKFLKTVVNKNFEFMHEMHEGVQDMACDTFMKIAQKCRRHFVLVQQGETEPFIKEIIKNIPVITSDLSASQVHTFYEACGYMISAQVNMTAREQLVSALMEIPNQAWAEIMQQANTDVDVFSNPETVKRIANILKTNVAACTSIGSFFMPQIASIYLDLLGMYKVVSGIISDATAAEPTIATKTPKIRGLRTIKKETLKLFEKYLKKVDNLQDINDSLVPPLLESILTDYSSNIPDAREPEVLLLTATIVNRMGELMNPRILPILQAVFEPTLNMINKDFSEYPEHRLAFFTLLRAINLHCFGALLELPPAQFKLFMDSIVWGIKHTLRDIGDLGMNIAYELVENVTRSDAQVANGFFQQFYLPMIQDVFYVLTDVDHKSGFKFQTDLLAKLIGLVEQDQISVPLFDPATQDSSMDNKKFVRDYVANLLRSAFPHVQSAQIASFVTSLFELYQDPAKFKLAVRDFLIQLREFQGTEGDNSDLFSEEKEAEKARQEKLEKEKAAAVPGLAKPTELNEMDDEL
ncbi:hypothetical protein BT69DRAFT_1353506 [Atractiella rhizophila]|nr:hypothetical protein BT69DRAFT_1353506 [Atractiella rhizophila]